MKDFKIFQDFIQVASGVSDVLAILSVQAAITLAGISLNFGSKLITGLLKVHNVTVFSKCPDSTAEGRSLIRSNGVSQKLQDMGIEFCHCAFKVLSCEGDWNVNEKIEVRPESIGHVEGGFAPKEQ